MSVVRSILHSFRVLDSVSAHNDKIVSLYQERTREHLLQLEISRNVTFNSHLQLLLIRLKNTKSFGQNSISDFKR